ncbi:hypothetical protein K3495_g10437 [Podosphaera aphanis]|nr:hypothetical protein K3495_g10437 [Podosphaera aphanis]
MSTSIVARGCFPSIFLSIFVLVFVVLASAQSVTSTNNTLPVQQTNSAFILQLEGSPLFDDRAYVVIPLTVAAGMGQNSVALSAYNIQGGFKYGDGIDERVTDSDVALISCDSTGSNNASEVVGLATQRKPQAIILYSLNQKACTQSGDYDYQSIYSLATLNESRDLLSTIARYPPSAAPLQAVLYANSTNIHDTPVLDTNNEGGPAPTTAVAMSILYSITGIITLLFLIIIATGAIRAHRHPERYGPRGAGYPGTQRQSLAKGLAKAILETLPIVKFGDPVPLKGETQRNLGERPIHTDLEDFGGKSDCMIEEGRNERMGPIVVNSLENKSETYESDLGCSICTEDFKAGEDLRVLPCNHKFHPACVDPWLLNVCGTCPLCRFDLRPASDKEVNDTQNHDTSPPLARLDTAGYITSETSNPHRNRISRFWDLNRLRHAHPDESIAVLRQLRRQLPAEYGSRNIENADEQSRRSRLTKRLKDAFHVKTRTQTGGVSLSI